MLLRPNHALKKAQVYTNIQRMLSELCPEKRHTPHLSEKQQGQVAQLMREYPMLDQTMAEAIVWDYDREGSIQRAKEEEWRAEMEGCKEATSGKHSAVISSPQAMSGPSSACATTLQEIKRLPVLEGATISVATPPPATGN